MLVTLLIVYVTIGNAFSGNVPVDSCTISGNGHIQTLDGARYDLHGVGFLSAVRNQFLDYQIQLVATDSESHSYLRRTSVIVKGDGLCRAADCPNRHNIIISYGVDVTSNVTDPDSVYVTFQHATDSSANFQTQLLVTQFLRGKGVTDAVSAALTMTGVVLRAVDNVTMSVEIRLDVQAPVVISIGPAFTSISTEALGGALAGADGLCGLYTRTAVDDFGGAVLGARADFYSNAKIAAWAEQFARTQDLFPANNQTGDIVTTALSSTANKLEFWSTDALMSSLQDCPGANNNVSFRLCVRDYTLPSGPALGRSNYDAVRIADLDSAYIASQSTAAATPTLVERRESAKVSTTVAAAVSGGLGVACIFGLIANRRLRQRQSVEMTKARASAIRLADSL